MTVGRPEGVSIGLSDKLATIGLLEGDDFQGGYLVAAWHRQLADGFQIAVVLPGPAEALPHYSTDRRRTGGARGPALKPPTIRTGLLGCSTLISPKLLPKNPKKQKQCPFGVCRVKSLYLRNHLKTGVLFSSRRLYSC